MSANICRGQPRGEKETEINNKKFFGPRESWRRNFLHPSGTFPPMDLAVESGFSSTQVAFTSRPPAPKRQSCRKERAGEESAGGSPPYFNSRRWGSACSAGGVFFSKNCTASRGDGRLAPQLTKGTNSGRIFTGRRENDVLM